MQTDWNEYEAATTETPAMWAAVWIGFFAIVIGIPVTAWWFLG